MDKKMSKVTVPNVSDGTMKEMFVGKDGQLIDPELVKAEEQKIADEAAAVRREEHDKRMAEAKARNDAAEAQDALARSSIPAMAARIETAAMIRKVAYDAHIKVGFTPDQAIAIILKAEK